MWGYKFCQFIWSFNIYLNLMSVQRNNLSRLAELNATVFLTGVHPADLLDEGLVKPRDYGAPNWYHEVLVQALNEGIYPSNTSSLTKGKKIIKQNKPSFLFLSLKKQIAKGN